MSARASLVHRSLYRYDRDAALGPHIIRLRPAPHARAIVRDYELRVTPAVHKLHWQQDPFGNWQARVLFPAPTRELEVMVRFVVERVETDPFDFVVDTDAQRLPIRYQGAVASALAPYLEREQTGVLFEQFVASLGAERAETVAFIVALNQRIRNDFKYLLRDEPDTQSAEATLASRQGACRDFAWLMTQTLRALGIAARYVSGYALHWEHEASGQEAELHAWTEAYLPGAGWIGFDPTAGLLAGDGHIPLAAVAHYEDAAPIVGTSSTGASDVSFALTVTFDDSDAPPPPRWGVQPLFEAADEEDNESADPLHLDTSDPNADLVGEDDLTLPASAWTELNALGARIDTDLTAQNVRLTMGGEPTFVALDGGDAPEWTLDAIGPTKTRYADALLRKLRARFAPNGRMLHGRGKQYPNEPAPRWAYSLIWRRDGKPIWRDADRIAKAGAPAATREDAQRLAEAIADRLALPRECVLGAYLDPLTWLEREANLPHNLAPSDPRLVNDSYRALLARVRPDELGQPVGFVIPMQREREDARPSPWRSELWRFRRGALILIGEEGPIGDRLPLASLPVLDPGEFPMPSNPDPFEVGEDLSDRPEADTRLRPSSKPVRTAMAIEARDDVLCVFMPPVERLEHYLELLSAIEDASAKTSLLLRIEGYPPPSDPRLVTLSVTPDPGVIEVNVHPGAAWSDAVAITKGVYADARAVGLCAETFRADGVHSGTGGGNHIVFGAAHPNESPFLRRPDLLKSMLIYWQRHPALSYFFSGQFVGPTSQAPRVDEARHEALYELEIALAQIPAPGEETPAPWVVDRLLRNLLADMSGNTHRAEICIDKLYAPQGPMGRLGLVELRAFEMAPNEQMSLARQALLRALIAWLWREPLDGPLIRWGTALSDRFMLPECVWRDFLCVLNDLRHAGYVFDPAWFEPDRRFRFPLLGATEAAGVAITLRQALEPWHVLAEHHEDGGVSRPVDSSPSRVEVLAEGFDPARHAIACNDRRLPMTETSAGGHIAGVRFKSWKPARGLHPTLNPNWPLRFELFDLPAGKAVAAFSYRAYAGDPARPTTAADAGKRRRARFSAKAIDRPAAPPPEERTPECPLTLDLRRWNPNAKS
jgi:uncharacterized protein (DUF2126 family)/transglutaminase-like putative cysteine protease